ncbi:MAG: class I SAM-dependent methyltransferase [Deltaproteobacteria bacterium]|nr:class I SAM-dependent methyltransferase [Deltaproteobacteria bacterium]
MGYIFDFKAAQQYDDWYLDPKNRFVADLEDQLIARLLEPVRGERILDIGCGTGRNLVRFLEMGLDVAGLDASPYMLDVARKKLGHRANLYKGFAEDLPFEDNSFDVATLITTLEFADDAQKALAEACRVASNRIFLGVLNQYAIKGVERRIKGIFSNSIFNRASFFSLWELKQSVRELLGKVPIEWGTVPQLPAGFRKYSRHFEKWSLVQRSPFGTFIGMTVILIPRFKAQGIPVGYVRKPGRAMPGLMQTPTQTKQGD